jgi:hypothetical protein
MKQYEEEGRNASRSFIQGKGMDLGIPPSCLGGEVV